MLAEIDSKIDELDSLYVEVIDRIEQQAKDALIIDRAIRLLLDQPDDDSSIMNWDPEKTINPRAAYRYLAIKLTKYANQHNLLSRDVTSIDYEDLLAWPANRTGAMTNAQDELMARIAFARTRSFRSFWDELSLRISPQRSPGNAEAMATGHLMKAFSVLLNEQVIVPYKMSGQNFTLMMPLRQSENDLEWVVSQPKLLDITRATHAISTICSLNGRKEAASMMLEMNASFYAKMIGNFRQYSPKEYHYAGSDVMLNLSRDHARFRLHEEVFGLVSDVIPRHVVGVHLHRAPN